MKTLIVRLSVLSLVATGFAASTVATKASKAYNVNTVTVGVSTSAALCPPNGSQGYCGLK